MLSRSKIPRFNCLTEPDGKLCTACCTVVPFTDKDKAAMSARKPLLTWERTRDGSAWIIVQAKQTRRCPFVGEQGCTIHETPDYPMICRVHAVTDTLPCPIGRTSKRKLSDAEARKLVHDAGRL